jgi:tetratricopeptide (TPR) repeat protein
MHLTLDAVDTVSTCTVFILGPTWTMTDTMETTPLKNSSSSIPSQHASRSVVKTLSALCAFVAIAVLGIAFAHGGRWIYRYPPKGATGDDWIPNVIVGNYSLPISYFKGQSTDSPDVQQLFDVGMMECFGFSFLEAQTTALQALTLSQTPPDKLSHCPMCYWLLAMAHSPYINHPSLDHDLYQSAQRASEMAIQAATTFPPTPKETWLIEAIQVRFSANVEHQSIGYRQYQEKLEQLYQRLPSDTDVMAFLADALMILHCNADGYQFYEEDNVTPKPDIAHAMQLLERCLALGEHPLCQHLYIHITEPSNAFARRAESAADRLALNTASTQAQHLQHMPSHTYLRIGRYHDAVLANILAHASDEAFLGQHHVPYGPAHDTCFLVHAATMSGEMRLAYQFAHALREHYRAYPTRSDYPDPQLGWHIWRTVRLRFGDHAAILQDYDEMPGEWPYAQVLGHYAKGVASLHVDTVEASTNHLRLLQGMIALVDDSFLNVATVANLTLASAIEYRKGNAQDALVLVRNARQEQESWAYTEPPAWHMSVAGCEAALLLIMGQTDESIKLFEHDLENIPENRYTLYGLWQAMKKSGKDESQLKNVTRRLDSASQWADNSSVPPIVCPLYTQASY